MDCNMPLMDGLEATRRIRMYEESTGLKKSFIVGLTAYTGDEHRQAFITAGADYFMSKPVCKENIDQIIREVGCWK